MGLKYDLQNLSKGKWHRSTLPSKWRGDPPFQRRAEVLGIIAANCGFFLNFSILQLLFLLSTTYFSPPPLFSAVFTNLTEIYTRQRMSGSPHFEGGTCLRSLLKGVVCLAHKMGLPLGLWTGRDMGLILNVWPQHSWSSVWEWIWILWSPVSMFGKHLCHMRTYTALTETSGVSGEVLGCAGWPRLCSILKSLVSLNIFLFSSLNCGQCAVWSLASSQCGAECCAVGSETVFSKFIGKSFCTFSVSAGWNWACSSALAPRQRSILT